MAALKVAVTRVRLGVDPGQRSAGSCRRVASWAQLSSWIGEVVNELGRQLLAGPVQRLLWRQRDAEPLDDGPIIHQARGPTLDQELRETPGSQVDRRPA